MVSLTPGTLQKLLQNAGDKEFKVAGEHRSALLQVWVRESSNLFICFLVLV